jgi:hypothetical protein
MRFVYVCKRRAESESRASDQGQSVKLLIHKNGSGAASRNSQKKKFSDIFFFIFWGAINILSGLSSSTTAKRGH